MACAAPAAGRPAVAALTALLQQLIPMMVSELAFSETIYVAKARGSLTAPCASRQVEEELSGVHDNARTVLGGRIIPLLLRVTPNPLTCEWIAAHGAALAAGRA